jgi:hypothetical protein
MDAVTEKRPSFEQIDRIRTVSKVALGSEGAAFEKYGYPSTRGQASELLRKMDAERGWGGEDNEQEVRMSDDEAREETGASHWLSSARGRAGAKTASRSTTASGTTRRRPRRRSRWSW